MAADGAQGPRLRARPRRARAVRRRLRRDRRPRSTSRSASSPLKALGLTPVVLLADRRCCSSSSRSRTRRGRRRSRRPAAPPPSSAAPPTTCWGFLTGWALFLDYLIVIALSTLFLPHYVGGALGCEGLRETPWDVVVARLRDRRRRGRPARPAQTRAPRRRRSRSRCSTCVVQLLLVVLGFALIFSPDALTSGLSTSATVPSWGDLAFALPAGDARLHGPRDGREPRRGDARARPRAAAQRSSPRSGSSWSIDRADRRGRPLRLPGRRDGHDRARRRSGCGRRSLGIVAALEGTLPARARGRAPGLRRPLRRARPARRGDDVVSGCTRLAHSMASTGSCRARSAGSTGARSSRRRRSSATAVVAIALVVVTGAIGDDDRLPRQPLLVRGPARLHGGAARGDPAPLRRAGAAAAVPRAARTCAARRRRAAAGARRRAADLRGLGASRSSRTRAPAIAGPAWLARRRRRLPRRARSAPRSACSRTSSPRASCRPAPSSAACSCR